MDTTVDSNTVFVRVLSPKEAEEFRSKPGVTIKSLKQGRVRCFHCGSSFTYATPSKAWLQQEASDINSDTAVEIMVYRCRACGKKFDDLSKRSSQTGPAVGITSNPPGPERMAAIRDMLKQQGIKVPEPVEPEK